MRSRFKPLLPVPEAMHHVEERLARLRFQLVCFNDVGGCGEHRDVAGTGVVVQRAHGRVAEAALRGVDDALEGEVVGGLGDEAEIGHGIADFEALVKARAADDAVVEAERHEAIFEFAHLEGGAHQDRHVVEVMLLALQGLNLLADGAGFLFAVPGGMHLHLDVFGSTRSVNSVLPSRPSLCATRCAAAPRMCSVER
ncbi:hypothetical protein AJ87_32635 [Rhizobium yanglingense]|nr:hypothetical protein AJ87_32635 [Rhizobium yanglingense]